MADLIAIVEGQTEQAFVERILAPHLGALGVFLSARLIGKPGRKGGRRPWTAASREIVAMLRTGSGKRTVHATTMFDFYAMPRDWPGRDEADTKPIAEKAACVEQALSNAICEQLGGEFRPRLFLPYVQMHELEALLFTDVTRLEFEFLNAKRGLTELAASVHGLAPEDINDSPQSAPSKRIIRHVPEYEGAKPRAAPEVLGLIGLPALRSACPHFGMWLTKLESLAPTATNR